VYPRSSCLSVLPREVAKSVGLGLTIATSPAVIGGLFLFGLSALTWLLVLGRIDLSTAYPFVALGIVLTTGASWAIFHETINLIKLSGIVLIVGGVLAVGLSAQG
jgi:multidrug transporter EmrE-like cation transporter